MNNVLITGSGGFIGGELLTKLNELGIRCYLLKHTKTNKIENHDISHKNIEINWENFKDWQAPKNDNWVIFHCGGASNYKIRDKRYLHDANVRRTQQIIDKFNSPKNLIVFMSTIGVYDRRLFANSKKKLTTTSKLSPKSRYGKSKKLAEAEIKKSNISYQIIRLAWIYGEKMRTKSHMRAMSNWREEGKLISKLVWPGSVSVGHIENLVQYLTKIYFEYDGRTQNTIINYADKHPANFSDVLTNFQNERVFKLPNWILAISNIFPSRLRILLEPQYLVYEDTPGEEVNFIEKLNQCKSYWRQENLNYWR